MPSLEDLLRARQQLAVPHASRAGREGPILCTHRRPGKFSYRFIIFNFF